jgi:hypothetical protein
LSIPVTGKAGEGLYSIIKIPSKFIYLTLQRPKYFEAISGSIPVIILVFSQRVMLSAAFSVDISDSLIVADAPARLVCRL